MTTEVHAQENWAGQKYALLIGVHDYSPPFKNLEYCYNDILALKERLLDAGFSEENIVLMHDGAKKPAFRPSKSNIEKQLQLRLNLANASDDILVAFSGHGVMDGDDSYLCPYDAALGKAAETMVSVDKVYDQLKACRAKQKLLLVDACRDEPVLPSRSGGIVVRGFAEGLEEPPKGVLVLASCEAGEWSAADPDLKHGVFSYYLIEGFKGAADQEYAGNKNGAISVFELYTYVHEKTKKHVANSHGISQRPVLRGEISGTFDLAKVPDRITDSLTRSMLEDKPETTETAKKTSSNAMVRSADHPLLNEAKKYLAGGDYDKAIKAYSALIDDGMADVAVRRQAREDRGAAYLARGTEEDIDNALIDHLALGKESLQLVITADEEKLKVASDVRGILREGQVVNITSSNGNWFWVSSVGGSSGLSGYIRKEAVVKKAENARQPEQPISRPASPRSTGSIPAGADAFTRQFMQRHGRPPGVMETPRWESPAEIRRLRAAGLLR